MSHALQRLTERVRAARADRSCLAIRGGGSKDFYGGPIRGALLDTTELAGISRYDPSELVITARAGTPLAELEAVLAEQGQCLPFEPPRYARALPMLVAPVEAATLIESGEPGAPADLVPPPRPAVPPRGGTVGGMVAAGLSGPGRATCGGVRDYVLGATLLNGRAELLSFGGQVMKNVAGYDVSRVLAGSMGVLGLICEVSLKVLPQPVASATLRFDLDELKALRQLAVWGGLGLPVSASAWWQGALVVRLSGAWAAVQAALRRIGGERIDAPLAEAFWRGLRDQTDEYFAAAEQVIQSDPDVALWRLSLPPTALPVELIGDQLSEWGGAQRWWLSNEPAARVREVAAHLGGHATLFRARDKARLLGSPDAAVQAPLKPPLDRLHRQLKLAFDPERVYNRDRLYPGI